MEVRPAGAHSLPAAMWRLLALCGKGPGGRSGYLLLACVAALDLLSVPIGLRLIQWNADFFNALQKVDVERAVSQIGVFGLLVLASASRFLAANYIRKHLRLLWRRSLTHMTMQRWLAQGAYWRLEQRQIEGDNPDQRIAEDCRLFVDRFTAEAVEILVACVALASYVSLLWSLSTFELQFSVFGYGISIPRYMIWAAPLYVLLASTMTHWLGAPLHRLAIVQQQREADFRFALARVREYAEPIALLRGEAAEQRALSRRFEAIADNFRALIRRELVQGLFTRPYQQTVLQIPLFLALPAYLAGRVTLGGLMQLRSAFQNVVTTLSYFIFSYRDLVELAAATRRLDLFLGRLDAPPDAGPVIRRAVHAGSDVLSWKGVRLAFPDGREATIDDAVVRPGEHVWISAPSGAGKTTFVKALGGHWRAGQGEIDLPSASLMFLPQQLYIPQEDLGRAVSYPAAGEQADLAGVLETVGLQTLLDPARNPAAAGAGLQRHAASLTLSGGEKQRLMLARLLVHKPAFALLDEPASALDADAEKELFARLVQAMPGTTFLIVSHGRPQGLPIARIVEVKTVEVKTAETRDVAGPLFTHNAVPAPCGKS